MKQGRMADVSEELEELDEKLAKAEKELDKGFENFVKALLLLFLFRLRNLPTEQDIDTIFTLPASTRRDLERLYSDYFQKISDLAETYSKAELLNYATNNVQRRRIENIKVRQRSYNRQYAAKLAAKQVSDLSELLNNSVITFLNENPGASAGAVRNLVRDKIRTFSKLRGSITAETEANRVTNQVRLELFRKSKIIKAVRFTAVLDKRTSAICRSRNGTVIPLNSSMLMSYTPPLHPRCRSYLVPVDIEATDYAELQDINEAEPAKPTAEVVNSW
jgi:SPP1 gp7 family putative phage head morphogenesis protein